METTEKVKPYNFRKPTRLDRFWAATLLWLLPRSVKPNHLTVLRFLAIPFVIFFLYTEMYGWGFGTFVFAALLDTWDGALARTRQQISEWGKIYDPFADKLLIGSTVLLVVPQYVGFATAMVIVVLELVLIVEAVYLKKMNGKVIQALPVGKIKMVLQSFGVGLLLLHLIFPAFWIVPLAIALIYISIGFAVASLVIYHSI